MSLKQLMALIRVKQWYKNLIVFFPLFFSANLLNFRSLSLTLIGFFCLSLISSSAYVINDITDIHKDRHHPKKKSRLIASGKVKVFPALFISIALFVIAIFIGSLLEGAFFWFLVALFLNINLYTFIFKSIAIWDVIVLGFDFVIRALAGIFLINAPMSAWLILFVFLLAIFLAISKRLYDLKIIGDKATKHKEVYKVYNEKFLEQLSASILILLLFSYILYTFLAYETYHMMITIPFVVYLIFRYLYFVSINHPAVGKTEKIFRDKGMVSGIALWALSCFIVLYLI